MDMLPSSLTTALNNRPPTALGEKISVIIPAYNEAAGIAQTLASLCAEEALQGAEFIVVDDGSHDSTAALAGQFPQVKVIHHPFNQGYGAAIRTGSRTARHEYILWFDSDGQHRVEDLVQVSQKLVGQSLEYVIGVREKASYQDKNRRLGKWLLKQAVDFSVGQPVPDFNSGLRGFQRDVLRQYLHLLPKGFGASTLTTLLMIEGAHHGDTVPILVQQRVGKSTVKQFRDGIRTLQIIVHIAILFKPMKFFGLSGAILILLGLMYGFIKANIIHLGFPIFASLLIILGVQAFFFGLLCDQISALRREKFSDHLPRV